MIVRIHKEDDVVQSGIDVDAWRRRVRDDTFANYHRQMGLALQASGEAAAATAAFERALAIIPDDAVAHYGFVTGLQQLGRNAEAEAAHRQAVMRVPDYRIRGMLAQGWDFLSKQRTAEAQRVFADALAFMPDCREAQLFLHYADLAEGRRHACPLSLEAADGLDPEPLHLLGIPYLHLSWKFTKENRLPEALEAFEQALYFNPSLISYLGQVGMIHWTTGHLDRLVSLLGWMTGRNSETPIVWNWLGQVLLVVGRRDDAMRAHQRALELDDKNSSALGLIGNLLQTEGRIDEALAWYDRASEILPGDIWIMSGRGVAEIAAGQPDKALDLQREVARIFSGARDNAWLGTHIALAEQSNGLTDAALATHRRVIAAEPHTVGFLAQLRPWALAELTAAYRTLDFDPADLKHVQAILRSV